jgi:hypothetical protein
LKYISSTCFSIPERFLARAKVAPHTPHPHFPTSPLARFIDDPKVKEVAQGRKVNFIQQINLLCEMGTEYANKIVVELIHEDFEKIREFFAQVV